MIEEVLLWAVFGVAFGVGANVASVVSSFGIAAMKSAWLRWWGQKERRDWDRVKAAIEVEMKANEPSGFGGRRSEFEDFPGIDVNPASEG